MYHGLDVVYTLGTVDSVAFMLRGRALGAPLKGQALSCKNCEGVLEVLRAVEIMLRNVPCDSGMKGCWRNMDQEHGVAQVS